MKTELTWKKVISKLIKYKRKIVIVVIPSIKIIETFFQRKFTIYFAIDYYEPNI